MDLFTVYLFDLFLVGAPAIATASGEYVAGNPVKRLASATLPDSKGKDFEGQCESFWRVCEGMKTPSDRVVVTANSPLPVAPCPAKASEETPALTEVETPRTEDPDHAGVEERPTPPVEVTGDGYSVVPDDVTPPSGSNTASKSKFDATYHKIHVCKHLNLLIFFGGLGFTLRLSC